MNININFNPHISPGNRQFGSTPMPFHFSQFDLLRMLYQMMLPSMYFCQTTPVNYGDYLGAHLGCRPGPSAVAGRRPADPARPGVPNTQWKTPLTPTIDTAAYKGEVGGRVAAVAGAWTGKHFKQGQDLRCADFVSTVIEQSGAAPKGFRHEFNVRRLRNYGRKVSPQDMKPGDVVFFDNTWKEGKFTHVGVYIGDGKFVHRSGMNTPVKVDSLVKGKYAHKFSEVRRLSTAEKPGTLGNATG
jgi:NlpC/P60 family